ncbi:MAG: cellulase family glycosylhydrolase [Phycisphaerae bacterium]
MRTVWIGLLSGLFLLGGCAAAPIEPPRSTISAEPATVTDAPDAATIGDPPDGTGPSPPPDGASPDDAPPIFNHPSVVGASDAALEASPDDTTPIDAPAAPASEFIHASGKDLVVAEGAAIRTIQLRGINVQSFWLLAPDDLSNPFINDDQDRGVPIASLIPTRYDETVVTNIAALGANVIRNAVNYRQFEDNAAPYAYKPEGWAQLDEQIALAKAAGLYTIIDLHVPPGGLQGVAGASARLWEDVELQDRTASLWQAIAARYQDEPWVAGYDLINEPMPTQRPSQWATFAQRLVDAIRVNDKNHLIIVGEIVAVVDAAGNYPPIDPNASWIPKVADENVMYDFHFYKPLDYVGQGRPENGLGDNGQIYPDATHTYVDDAGNPVGVRDKAYLQRLLDEKLAFGRIYNVPMNVGEFSPSRITFFSDSTMGGLEYTADLMDLMNVAGLNYEFYAYLNVFFLDWEYAEMPELYAVTDALSQTIKQGMQ